MPATVSTAVPRNYLILNPIAGHGMEIVNRVRSGKTNADHSGIYVYATLYCTHFMCVQRDNNGYHYNTRRSLSFCFGTVRGFSVCNEFPYCVYPARFFFFFLSFRRPQVESDSPTRREREHWTGADSG